MKKIYYISSIALFAFICFVPSHQTLLACDNGNAECSKAVSCPGGVVITSPGCFLGPICGAPDPVCPAVGNTGGANTTGSTGGTNYSSGGGSSNTCSGTLVNGTCCTGKETSGVCRPELTQSSAYCIEGTSNTVPVSSNGNTWNGGECLRQTPTGTLYSPYCTGTAVDGPCAPTRINQYAASAAAAAMNASQGRSDCTATRYTMPTSDITTGLNYFYDVSCANDSGSHGGSTGSGTKPTNTGSGSHTGTTGTGGSITNGTGSAGATAAASNLIGIYMGSLNQTTATVNNALGSTGGNGSTSGSTGSTNSCPQITLSVRLGDFGDAVTIMTRTLVNEGLLSAPQSVFDQSVFDAVVKYQEKYASKILTPSGLDRGTGFVGPSTRNYMNAHAVCSGITTQANPVPAGTTQPVAVGTTPGGGANTNCTSDSTNPSAVIFCYTFTKNTNGWLITAANPQFSTQGNNSYIPAHYVINASSAQDLNMQAQGRFNNMALFPGTPEGNSFFQKVFGTFIDGFYKWDVNTTSAPLPISYTTNTSNTGCPDTQPNSLSANCFQSITVKAGDTINYVWTSNRGISFSSRYTANKPDTCVGGFGPNDASKPWVAKTASGSVSDTVKECQRGVTYVITYTIHNGIGMPDINRTATVSVSN